MKYILLDEAGTAIPFLKRAEADTFRTNNSFPGHEPLELYEKTGPSTRRTVVTAGLILLGDLLIAITFLAT